MLSVKPPLSPEALERLRDSVNALRSHSGGAMPHGDCVRVASAAGDDFRVTVDLTASELLGAPLVVLEPSVVNAPWLAGLSPRERQIVLLVADGLANKEIAQRLSISVGTVKDHVHQILVKTGLSNRAALAAGVNDGHMQGL